MIPIFEKVFFKYQLQEKIIKSSINRERKRVEEEKKLSIHLIILSFFFFYIRQKTKDTKLKKKKNRTFFCAHYLNHPFSNFILFLNLIYRMIRKCNYVY